MPDIPQGNQVFDLEFSTNDNLVFSALLNGRIRAYGYDNQTGDVEQKWELRPTKRSCRGIAIGLDGHTLWSVSKDKTIQ